jgi:hypothetical protein
MLNNIEKQDVQNRHTSQKPIFLCKVDERLFRYRSRGLLREALTRTTNLPKLSTIQHINTQTLFMVHSTYANILKKIYKKVKKIVGIG